MYACVIDCSSFLGGLQRNKKYSLCKFAVDSLAMAKILNNNNYYFDGCIYLNLSKSLQSAERAESFEACCQWALLNVQFITILFTFAVHTEVHLSFCNYINENGEILKVCAGEWTST